MLLNYRVFLILFGLFCCFTAEAVVLRMDTQAGLMQQPSSQYYLYTYGGNIELGIESWQFYTRLSFFERPAFRSKGYEDQDYGAFVQFGKKITRSKQHGLLAYMGYGEIRGHIRREETDSAPELTRRFAVEGLMLTLEYEFLFGNFKVAANHQSFVGITGKSDLEVYTAWPFNFVNLSFGYVL